MSGWSVERIVQFEEGEFLRSGLAHFGFHLRDGRYCAIAHRGHAACVVGRDGRPEVSIAAEPVLEGVPNIAVPLDYPIYADLLDDTLLLANFGDAQLLRVDLDRMRADVLVEGHRLGLADMGNCVVDDEGCIWVNEVTGCRVWRFDRNGRPLDTLGDGVPGFTADDVPFGDVRFGWIYDLRRGPDGDLVVLDSGNFAVRGIDRAGRCVRTMVGTGEPGVFGSDPTAQFDGPISLSVDELGNAYVGDRFDGVVRMIERTSHALTSVAGSGSLDPGRANDPAQLDPLRLNLPQISSMDYADGLLYVPTDLDGGAGDLVILRRAA